MKKLLSLMAALVLIIGIVAPVTVQAGSPCPPLPLDPVTATWTSNNWTSSYFWITLSETGDLNGTYEGWCIDIHRPTPKLMVPNQALLKCSYSPEAASYVDKPENIDLVNWIFNHNPIGMDAGGILGVYTLFDLQTALWRLLENTPPDYVDGPSFSPYVDTDRVATLIAMAQANGEGYTSDVGDLTAIFVIPLGLHPDSGQEQQISLITVVDPPVVVGGTVMYDDLTKILLPWIILLVSLLLVTGGGLTLKMHKSTRKIK